MLGPLGPPHVENQALALKQRGLDVSVGGNTRSLPELRDSVIEGAGIPVSEAPDVSRSSPWGVARTVRWARSLIRSLRPDVVHAHWLPGFGLAAALAGARPLALTAWGSDVYRAGSLMRLADRVAVRRADLVMADSQDLLDRCVSLGAAADRVAVVQWGVDLETFSPAADRQAAKRRLGLGPGPVVLSPRSLMPVYNIPTVIEAFGIVSAQVPDAQLVIKHMGVERVELPRLEDPERMRLVGKVPYEKMAEYYRAADVCVSIASSDSSPRSVWEAMACGCPCVLSDLPWVEEQITPGSQALKAPIAAADVGHAIVRILDDPKLAQRLSAGGRALVERSLDREKEMNRLVDLYAAIAERGGAG